MWEVCRKRERRVQAEQSKVDQGRGSVLLRVDEPTLWHQHSPSFCLMRKRGAGATGPFSSFSSHWHCSHECECVDRAVLEIKTGGDWKFHIKIWNALDRARCSFRCDVCFWRFSSDTHLSLHVREIMRRKNASLTFISLLRNKGGISASSQRSK